MTDALLYFPGMQTRAVLTEKKVKKKKKQKKEKRKKNRKSRYISQQIRALQTQHLEHVCDREAPACNLTTPTALPHYPGLDNRDSEQESQRSTHLGNYLMGDSSHCLHVGIGKEKKNPTASQTA